MHYTKISIYPLIENNSVVNVRNIAIMRSYTTLFQSTASIDHNGRHYSLLLSLVILHRLRLVRVQLLPHLLDGVVLGGQHLLEVPVGPRLTELLLQLLLCHVELVLDLEEPG